MRFDWLKFCNARGVQYVASGPRVSKGNINVHCPWCGAADKSGHMGLSLNIREPFYGCLRNATHRGKNPARLVARLLGIPHHAAELMVTAEGVVVDDFERAVEQLREMQDKIVAHSARPPLRLPPEFISLRVLGHYADRFINYLSWQRGFLDDATDVACTYELYYALTGPQAWRVIFPIREGKTLWGWTGRDIRANAKLRYLTSENLPGDALLDFDDWHDHAAASSMVLVCEGPLDALKLDYYGRQYGLCAVATMGTGRADVSKAAALRRRYPVRVGVVLDADATGQALEFAEELGARVFFLPPDVKDPGELPREQAQIFLQKVAKTSCI